MMVVVCVCVCVAEGGGFQVEVILENDVFIELKHDCFAKSCMYPTAQ